ncbi:MAG: hypothetical protein R3Y32_03135 [Bacillota bacterium]
MYIPKFRTAEDVVIYFRERDPKSVITRGLIYNLVRNGRISGFNVGRKCVVNLDEVIFYLNGTVRYDIPTKQPTCIVTAKTAYKMLKEKDPVTKLSRDVIREIVASGALGGVTSGIRTYFDFNKLMAYVSPTCFAPAPKKIPRLRNYEKTYHHIHKYTKLPITWDRLHSICHSGEVLCELHGNRWVVDFDVIKNKLSHMPPLKENIL